MGLMWSFITPLIMLVVYTFVFGVVFKSRWGVQSEENVNFSIILFSGLIIFNFISECINKSPFIVIGNINYVKKVIFPLEVLPVVVVLSSMFHLIVSLVVWVLFFLISSGLPPMTIIYLPIVMLPVIFFALGLSWFLSASGVFFRDISQMTGILTSILMFMSPIFYSVVSLPEKYQTIMRLNPLTATIEQVRDVMIWGHTGDWKLWFWQMLASVAIAWLGFAWFQKTRKGFSDVL